MKTGITKLAEYSAPEYRYPLLRMTKSPLRSPFGGFFYSVTLRLFYPPTLQHLTFNVSLPPATRSCAARCRPCARRARASTRRRVPASTPRGHFLQSISQCESPRVSRVLSRPPRLLLRCQLPSPAQEHQVAPHSLGISPHPCSSGLSSLERFEYIARTKRRFCPLWYLPYITSRLPYMFSDFVVLKKGRVAHPFSPAFFLTTKHDQSIPLRDFIEELVGE